MLQKLDGQALWEEATRWLARTPAVLRAHVQGQGRETLIRQPRAKAWSQTEILAHLADFEVICFQARLEQILRGEPISALDADRRAAEVPYAAIAPATSLDVFERERGRSLARIQQLSPQDLTRRTVHRELGELSLANLLMQWVEHDLSHIRQLVSTAEVVFRPGTERGGPAIHQTRSSAPASP
jgi:hypothetical protein